MNQNQNQLGKIQKQRLPNMLQIKQKIQQIKKKNESKKKQLQQFFVYNDNSEMSRMFNKFKETQDNQDIQQLKISKFQNTLNLQSESQIQKIPNIQLNDNQKFSINRNQRSQRIKTATKRSSTNKKANQTIDSFRIEENQIQNFKIKKIQKGKQTIKQQEEDTDQKNQNYYLQKFYSLYEILVEISQALGKEKYILKKVISNYAHQITTGNYDFIDQIIESVQKKYQKLLNFSRTIENIAIIYLSLQLAKDTIQQQYVNINNTLGHCASNILFFAKIYVITKKIKLNPANRQFLQSMTEFQKLSFKQELISVEKTLLRVQHNNQILTILENKLGRNNLRFSTVFKKFLRNFQRENYKQSQIMHYLFQYLSYYLYQNQFNGIIPALDMSPAPYLSPQTQNKYTIIIEPYGVLFLLKNDKMQIRPFTKQFLNYIYKYFQVIFWTWMMPNQIDKHISKLDNPLKISNKLYKYHCKYDKQIYFKDITRLNRDLETTLIVDYDYKIYTITSENGIQIPWHGNQKDNKLLDLTQIIVQMLKYNISVPEIIKLYHEEIKRLKTKPIRKSLSKY